MGCSSARNNMLHDLDVEMSEKEEQPDQRDTRHQERAGEEHPEESVIVLEVHVEHHDDRKLQPREKQQREAAKEGT
jgi:DsbC/DsbD-like thiol-disulfide interchange protein